MGAGVSSLRPPILTFPHVLSPTTDVGLAFAHTNDIVLMPRRRKPMTVCTSWLNLALAPASCDGGCSICASQGFTVTLVRCAMIASSITMPVPGPTNLSGRVVLKMHPFSSYVQSVRRKRSEGSRPTIGSGRPLPSRVQHMPDSKKSCKVGKNVCKPNAETLRHARTYSRLLAARRVQLRRAPWYAEGRARLLYGDPWLLLLPL
jgi:hypothetical protein